MTDEISNADKDLVTKVDDLAAAVGTDWKSLNSRLAAIEAPNETPDGEIIDTAATSGIIYYNDPFTTNNQPVSLSLPLARDLLIATLTANPAMRGELVTVYAASWYNFYQRLTLASAEYPIFAETIALIKQRFGFADVLISAANEDPFAPEVHELTALDVSPIDHWQGRYDLVCSATFLTLYPAITTPDEATP